MKITVKKTNKPCTKKKVVNEGKDVKGKDMDKSVQEMENVKKYIMEDIKVQVKGLIEEGDAEQGF